MCLLIELRVSAICYEICYSCYELSFYVNV